METLQLSVGIKDVKGDIHKTLPIYRGGSEIEKIYTGDKSTASLYTWFADVICASISYIGDEPIAEPFLTSMAKGKRVHSELILKLPLSEVGNLLVQIQRECWQDIIKDQQTLCKWCGDQITIPEVDLNKITIPVLETGYPEFITVDISNTKMETSGIEAIKELSGQVFNRMSFSLPTLGDAIRHESVGADDILFWRKIANDCLRQIEYAPVSPEDPLSAQIFNKQYISLRGTLIMSRDLNTKDLKKVRDRLQNALPSANMYYDDTCPCPKKRTMPYFVVPGDFFS